MPYHTEVMIFEILNLYYTITGNSSLSLNLLEEAFYALQETININEKISLNNIFEQELDKLQGTMPESITFDNEEITLNDIDLAYGELIYKYPKLTEIDYAIQEYVHNLYIYRSLNLEIPLEETKEIFDINRKIVQLYLTLGENDLKGKNTLTTILCIRLFLKKLREKLNTIDTTMIDKIKMCCAYYNYEYLKDGDENFLNSNWKIILFSNNSKQYLRLTYDKVEYLSEMIDAEMSEENEEILNDYLDELLCEENNEDYCYEEIPLFLTYFLIYLNKFILNNRKCINTKTLENLLTKKYLLLCIPELHNIEEYYLEKLTIDDLKTPQVPQNWATNTSFQILLPTVNECALSLDYSDIEIRNKPYLHSKIIINSIFIKCFLNLSINENDKKDIITLITNNFFYKHKDYKITTNAIDEIIFNNDFNLSL